jgi:hypothetical protein
MPPDRTAAAEELLTSHRSLYIVAAPSGRTNLLAQAAVLEVAGMAWTAAGLSVAVATSGEQAANRWRTLTGLGPHLLGGAADVVVVDHADRRTTSELLAMLRDVARAGAKAVLVEGGTSPRLTWRRSTALDWIGEEFGRLDPGPTPDWAGSSETMADPVSDASRGRGYRTARQAALHLVASWANAWSGDERALLVGLGYAECDALNQAARAVLVRRGDIGGPRLSCGRSVIQAGDHVLALRRLPPAIPPGASLPVLAVDARRCEATVRWEGRGVTLDRVALTHVGYGYAVTAALAARTAQPLMVLGPPSALGSQRGRVVTASQVAPLRAETRVRTPRPTLWRDCGPGIEVP